MRVSTEEQSAVAVQSSWRERLRVVGRYTLFQLPGLVGSAAVLALLVWTDVLAPRTAALLYLLWVAKEIALYPLTRDAYRGHDASDPQRLVGRRGVARQDLAPRGWVFVGGALWRAEVGPNEGAVAAGAEVEVVAVRGHRLEVTAARETSDLRRGA
jgi:membrane protein implicated in regulation of membrane protease activity